MVVYRSKKETVSSVVMFNAQKIDQVNVKGKGWGICLRVHNGKEKMRNNAYRWINFHMNDFLI